MKILDSEFSRHWLLSEGVRQWLRRRTIRQRFRTRVTQDDRRILAMNTALRGRHAGRRCFVLGNGPSLAQVDLTALVGDISIGMNSIQRHPATVQWSPTYYCRAEPGAAYNTAEKLRSIQTLTSRLNCEGYFFPIDARQAIEDAGLLTPSLTYYFKSIVDLTEWPVGEHEIDLADGMPYVGNTAQFAILLAMYVGANPIILLGMDHDFLAHRSINRHFYAADAEDAGGSDDLRIYPYKKMMADTIREWERYEVIHAIAKRQGTTILNATRGSFLDVYPSAELSDLLDTPPASKPLVKSKSARATAAMMQ